MQYHKLHVANNSCPYVTSSFVHTDSGALCTFSILTYYVCLPLHCNVIVPHELCTGTLAFCRRWLDRPDGGSTFLHGSHGGQQV
jgi:hypothetical protein